ncbi:MAG: glycosyltransferase family 4 protein [Gammaproteobacteria bacterium]|nr:glycosyltransferase family 4 protein [Gammaproteobacteria bacterium]
MRVAIACPGCGDWGSVASVARKHAKEISKYYDCVVFSDGFLDANLGGAAKVKVNSRHFNFLRRFCHVPNEIAFAVCVRRHVLSYFGKKPIDVLLCHGHVLAAIVGSDIRVRHDISCGLVVHGDIFERPKRTYDIALTVLYKWATPIAYKNSNLVMVLASSMVEGAIRNGAAADLVYVIPNGVDLEDIGLADSRSWSHGGENKRKGFRLLYVGRLAVEKGIDVLIRSCALLRDRNIQFSLDVIGEGRMRPDLERLVSSFELEDRIRFLGHYHKSKLGPHYLTADLVCVPSRSDTFPSVVLESLAAGTPVLASNVGGIPSIVKHNWNGLLVPSESPEAVAREISDLISNEHRLNIMQQAAIASVVPKYTWDRIGLRIRDVLEKLPNRSGVVPKLQ